MDVSAFLIDFWSWSNENQ